MKHILQYYTKNLAPGGVLGGLTKSQEEELERKWRQHFNLPCILGAERVATVPQLLARAQDDCWEVRYAAAVALGNVGAEHAATVMPQLLEMTKDIFWMVSQTAAEALGILGVGHEAIVRPRLLEITMDMDISWPVRKLAAEALDKLGAEHSATVPPQAILFSEQKAIARSLVDVEQDKIKANDRELLAMQEAAKMIQRNWRKCIAHC